MSDPRPELIFISGPQKDQRAVIMKNVVILGRSPSADIVIAEEHASRRQVRFEVADDGWIVENLSKNPIQINGKKYKPGKQVLLETGDVLGVGLETEILFVDAGDDPDIALSAWLDTHAEPEPVEIAPDTAVEPPPEPEPLEHPSAETPKSEPPKTAEIEKTEDPIAAERKAKMKKYAIGGAIYLAAMIVLVVVLVSMKKDGTIGPKGQPRRLTNEQIEEALDYKITDKPESLVSAQEELKNAINYYQTIDDKDGNLYLCVRSFKLYLAYSETHVFEKSHHEDMYKRANSELVDQVVKVYRSAYITEKKKLYYEAREIFRMLRQILPEWERGNPVSDVIRANVNKHVEYCKKRGKLKD